MGILHYPESIMAAQLLWNRPSGFSGGGLCCKVLSPEPYSPQLQDISCVSPGVILRTLDCPSEEGNGEGHWPLIGDPVIPFSHLYAMAETFLNCLLRSSPGKSYQYMG